MERRWMATPGLGARGHDEAIHDRRHGGPMSSILPGTREFRTPVYGTVFGTRTKVVHRLRGGDRLILVPDPPGTEDPSVWVHAPGGDVVGHLSPDVNSWLVPWMLDGGRCGAIVEQVR